MNEGSDETCKTRISRYATRPVLAKGGLGLQRAPTARPTTMAAEKRMEGDQADAEQSDRFGKGTILDQVKN